MSGELLGISTVELQADLKPLREGLATAERESAAAAGRIEANLGQRLTAMTSGLGSMGREVAGHVQAATTPVVNLGGAVSRTGASASTAELRFKGYALQVQAAEARVSRLSQALATSSSRQEALNAKLAAGAGDHERLTAQIAAGERQQARLNEELYLAQSRLDLAGSRVRTFSTGLTQNERAMAGLIGTMGPLGNELDILARHHEMLRHNGVDYLAAGFLGLGGVITSFSVKAALSFEELTKQVQRQTGLTGSSLDDLMGTIRRVARDSPYQLQQVAAATVILRQSFHESGTEIERNANLMIAFANASGQQVRPQMQQLSRIMHDYREPLGNVVELTDKLVGVSQATQQPLGDLVGTLDRFGPRFQALGFGLNDSIRLLGVFAASGVPVEQMGRGLATALTNVSKATALPKDAHLKLEEYGLAVQTAQQRVDALAHELGTTWAGNQAKVSAELDIARGRLDVAKQKYDALNVTLHAAKGAHGDVATAIHNEIEQITNAHSKQDALNIAVQEFGKNLGPSMARAFYDNQAALQKVDAALHKTGETQGLYTADSRSLHGEIGKLKSAANDLGIELGHTLVPALTDVAKWSAHAVHDIDGFVKTHKDLVEFAAGITGIGSALTLLSRHTPLGDILGRLFADSGHSSVASFLSGGRVGGAGAMSGITGVTAPGSKTNPIAVWSEDGFGGGGGSPAAGLGGGGGEEPTSRTSQILNELGKAGALLPFLPVAYQAGKLVAPAEAQPGTSSYGQEVLRGQQGNFAKLGGWVSSGSTADLLGGAQQYATLARDSSLTRAVQAQFAAEASRFRAAYTEVSTAAKATDSELTKLASHQQGIRATASNLDLLASRAAKVGDVKWAFADSLGAELLRSRSVTSRGVLQLIQQFDRLPPSARKDAADSMIQMTQQLEQQQRLPLGSTTRFVNELLANYQSARDKSGVYFRGLMTDTGAVMDRLEHKIHTSTGQQRDEAVAEYESLRKAASSKFDAMWSQIRTRQDEMTSKIQSGSSSAASTAEKNLYNYAYNVDWAMSSGVLSAQDGSSKIARALEDTIKAFGGKVVPAVVAVEKASIGASIQNTLGRLTGPVTGHAGGGLVQVGREGARGQDAIPLSVGGPTGHADILVGEGEKVAVFNHDQQRAMDVAVARTYGLPGLNGMFGRFNRPHSSHATGGFVPGFASGGVVLDPGVNMSVGQEPQILQDLSALSRELRETIFVISGYRSPAHSVAVGGFADDPHTRGEAADIGAGSASRDSMFGVSEAQLRAVGLYRPFYPPSASEVNHVQLLAGGAVGAAIAGAAGAIAAAVPALQKINTPSVTGTGTVPDIVRDALRKETDAANAYAQKQYQQVAGSISAAGWSGGGSAGANQALGHRMMLAAGWPESQWPSLLALWNQESGWDANSVNPSSGAYGIPQALGHGHPFNLGDAAGQIAWGLNYIRGRYGSPAAAEGHERAYNWYGRGGMVDLARMAGGGWVRTGATIDTGHGPQGGGAGEFAWNGGMSFAELLEAGHNAGMRPDVTQLLGLPRGSYGAPYGTWIRARMPGTNTTGLRIRKSDVGSGQAGNAHYTVDLHDAIAHALHWTPNGDIEIARDNISSTTSKGPKPKKTGPKKKPQTLPSLPPLRGVPGAPDAAGELTALDNLVGRYQAQQSYLSSLHGSGAPYTPLVTNADGSQTVNWGVKGGRAPTGIIDPSTGHITKGIYDRLAEIGDPGRNPNATATRDPNTELGIEELILDTLIREGQVAQGLGAGGWPWMGQLAAISTKQGTGVDDKEIAWLKQVLNLSQPWPKIEHLFGNLVGRTVDWEAWGMLASQHPWIMKLPAQYRRPVVRTAQADVLEVAREYRNAYAQVEHWKELEERLPAEKATRDEAIRHDFDVLKQQVRDRAATSKFSSSDLLSEAIHRLQNQEKSAKDAISKTPPRSWMGDASGWSKERAREITDLEGEFKAREQALRDQERKAGASSSLARSDALFRLGQQETADLDATSNAFAGRKTSLVDLIRERNTSTKNQKTWLTTLESSLKTEATSARSLLSSATASGGWITTVSDYIDPYGTLQLAIQTAENIDIPDLLQQIADATGTTVPASATGGSSGGTDSQLAGLDQQVIQQLGEQLAVSQAQYQVLSRLGDLPPFGGSFDKGGVVPGPTGAARLVVAHGGEEITPPGETTQPATGFVILVEDGAFNQDKIRVIAADEAQKHTRGAVRNAGQRLPSRGGGILV